MLVKFTGFNPLHPTDESQVVEIESSDIKGVVGSMTGDRNGYTTIVVSSGLEYWVKETVEQVNEKIGI